jgi:hypothetical protein
MIVSKTKELEISTIVVSGARNLFKAALARSILGVTFKKYRRRRGEFFANRAHNEAVTEGIFECLYELLLTHLRNVSDLDIKTRLKPQWDDASGRILSVSDVSVSVYMKVGELKIEKLRVRETISSVRVDLFFSEIDARSKELRSELPKIIREIGTDKVEFSEKDFLSAEGQKLGKTYGITTVPSILINAEKLLVDPDEKYLKQEIEKAFAARVEPAGNLEFVPDSLLKPNVQVLAQIPASIRKMGNSKLS